MTRILPLLLLAGCAAQPLQPPLEVQVPVIVPCLGEIPKRPAWEFDRTPKAADLYQKVDALLIEREQRKGYEAGLEAAMAGCR